MSNWKTIKDVPTNIDVDVWAIRQLMPNGEQRLEERRWPDVRLVCKKVGGTDRVWELWQRLPEEWTPTHWRPVPKGAPS